MCSLIEGFEFLFSNKDVKRFKGKWLMTINKAIIRAELYSVAFVRDYVQFGFHCETNDAGLTAYSKPLVTLNGIQYSQEDTGYRDALCGLIDQVVEDVQTENDDSIKIMFIGNDELFIRPNDIEREILVEYAVFKCGNTFQVWN